MKKWLTLLYITFFLVPTATMASSSLSVNNDILDPNANLQTDLGELDIKQIKQTKNNSLLNARQQLRDFVSQIKSGKGKFVQVSTGGKIKPPQSGTFAFERPGKFVWNISTPFEQSIISDGKTMYQYDPDLMQVTERAAQQAVGASPASILFGKGSLDANFILSDLPARDGMVWLRATPKVADAGMRYIDIAFADTLPVELIIVDSFGQTSSIKLHDFNTNINIASATFRFIAPKGVDRVRLN